MPSPFLRALLLAAAVLACGNPVEQELAGGGTRTFEIEAKGEPLLITVEQIGINVALRLLDPDGKPLGTMNAATDREGIETWLIPAGAEGEYRLEVRSIETEAPKGRFLFRVEELPATPAERIEAERLSTEAGLLFTREDGESSRKAVALYGEAVARWRTLGRKAEEARDLFRLAVVHQSLGESQPMLERLQEALPLFAGIGDRAQEADVLTYMGLAHGNLGRFQDAIASFERSLEIRRAREVTWGHAVTSQNLCLIRVHLGEWRKAIRCYEELLPLLEKVGQPDAEALNGLGGAYDSLGEPKKAREHYTRSLEKKRALKDRAGEAYVLNNLGLLSANQDDLGQALVFYGQALKIYQKIGKRDGEAQTLNNLGSAYLDLGEPRRALDLFNQVLPIRRELGDLRGEAATLRLLGRAQERLGDVSTALKSYEQALQIAKEMGDRAGEAFSLNMLAQGHLTAGDLKRALELFARSAALQRSIENRAGLAFALQRTGEIEARLGQREKALATLGEALDLRRLLEDPTGKAETLAAMATVERGLGRLESALAHAEEAIGLVESVRATVADPGLRASFLASRRLAFDLAISLRMELRGKGYAEEALALSERARARSLLDLLQESRTEIRQGIPQALLDREANLAFQLGRTARELRAPQSKEKGEQLQRELTGLLAEADRLQDEIRRSNPRYAVFARPHLDAAGIRGLLDRDTLLLEYSLGEERSFLWAVTPERVESFVLPGRAEIEAAARRSYEDVRSLEKKDPEAHANLSRLLFGKLADRLRGRRLVIVADGALQYVPFAILPDPGDPGAPLVAGHEIVSLPSASVLDVQRRLLAGRPPAAKAVAIFADPVFKRWDSRLPKAGTPRSPSAPGRTSEPALPLQRLPATEHEAEAIAKLLPAGQVLLALGPEASRDTALGGGLAGYRAVHFATHGMINSETPRLSFLALSMFDRQGRPQEGFLGLSDVYNLDLGAELVVLSGCETALGREIRGEGLMGLTQGFFYAGAERVMASLWRVEDRATAELMSRFYQAMLKDRLPPAAALRSAQLAIRGNADWQDPFYWAPFVLQGDWL